MPLPWKKAKVSRFSRIVADLQHPKPGNSSLVVETGFPTSLVDLFVKNRDRLKKPIKRRKKHQQHQQSQVEELVISDPIPLSNSRDLLVQHENENHRLQNLETESKILSNTNEVSVSEDQNLDVNNKGIKGCEGVDDANVILGDDSKNGKYVLIAVLKMFVVVVLALSTKRLALGITLSASFLIFLEYAGKHFFCFLKPCLNARMAFQSFVQRVVFFCQRRWYCSNSKEEVEGGSNVVLQGGDQDNNVVDCCDLIESVRSYSSIEEIQVVEPRLDKVARLEDNKGVEHETIRDLLRWDRRWGNLDMEEGEYDDEGGAMIGEKQHGRTCKMKRKIKKLVPKKLRDMRKGRRGKEKELKEVDEMSELSSYLGEDKLWRDEDTEEQDGSDQQEGKVKLWQLMEGERAEKRGNYERCSEKEEEMQICRKEGNEHKKEEEKEEVKKEGNENFEHRNSTFRIGLHTKSEKVVVEETVDIERGGNSGYLILFLIVLAGLVGGRVLALLITVASCSMLKLEWRRRKCVNDPAKLSPTSMPS